MGKYIYMDPKKQTNTSKHHKKTKIIHSKRDNNAANTILSTVDIYMKSIKYWAIPYLGETIHLMVTTEPIKISYQRVAHSTSNYQMVHVYHQLTYAH